MTARRVVMPQAELEPHGPRQRRLPIMPARTTIGVSTALDDSEQRRVPVPKALRVRQRQHQQPPEHSQRVKVGERVGISIHKRAMLSGDSRLMQQ